MKVHFPDRKKISIIFFFDNRNECKRNWEEDGFQVDLLIQVKLLGIFWHSSARAK